jgi:hypothetical protein
MTFLQSRSFRVGLLGALLLAVFLQVSRHGTQQNVTLPEPEWDTHGQVPGDPNNAVRDLKVIYNALNVYHTQFGSYPTSELVLMEAMSKYPTRYGIRNPQEATDMLMNPDSIYSDWDFIRKNTKESIAYQIPSVRYDGKPIGSSKLPGTRDVLSWTDLYVHNNFVTKNGVTTENPVGYYVLLWDDGSIQQVPQDQVLLVPAKNGDLLYGFPGQAGLPANAMTRKQLYASIKTKK